MVAPSGQVHSSNSQTSRNDGGFQPQQKRARFKRSKARSGNSVSFKGSIPFIGPTSIRRNRQLWMIRRESPICQDTASPRGTHSCLSISWWLASFSSTWRWHRLRLWRLPTRSRPSFSVL